MIADDIAEALPYLRAEAESRMTSPCVITRHGTGNGAWNNATGVFDPPARVVIYTGGCRVRNAFGAPQSTDAGETMWGVDQCVVSLPLNDPDGANVQDGDEVAVGGLRLIVQAGHFQTDSTARRLPCQVVTRDA